MKKVIASITVFLLLVGYGMNVDAVSICIDTDHVDDGVVGITYRGEGNTRYKVMIAKGTEQYYYDYFGPEKEFYPMQSGSGNYKVSVLENISGTQYRIVHSKMVKAKIKNDRIVFLQSVQNVRWSMDMEAISLAAELAEDRTSTREKVEAIYRFIVSNIDYDYGKQSQLDSKYVPDVEDTWNAKKGICYDYAALFASMLRSQGIPAKLIKGYTDKLDGYHAWNEVFIDGEWVVIDTTYDVIVHVYGENTNCEKRKTEYTSARVY